MKTQVTINRDDLIQLMAAAGLLKAAPTDKLDSAWERCWDALAPDITDTVALHLEITAVQEEMSK